jgi:hypothetical protein
MRLDWATIIGEGATIVRSYRTRVTLRQLHYRLVAANVGGYENTAGCYKQLSSRTAELRRAGEFPALADTGRSVAVPYFDDDVRDALSTMARRYRSTGPRVRTARCGSCSRRPPWRRSSVLGQVPSGSPSAP